MSEDKRKNNRFIKEQIRKKPFYKQKEFQNMMRCFGMVTIFGAIAGIVFAVVHPLALQYFGEPTKMMVVGEDAKATEAVGNSESSQVSDTSAAESDLEEKPSEGEQTAGIEKKELSLSDYQELYDQQAALTEAVKPSMVTVNGINSEEDLFGDLYENNTKAIGVVVAEQEDWLLVLTESGVIQNVEQIKVTFYDGTMANARIQKADAITDLAVLKVSVKDMGTDTRKKVKPATFGTSRNVEIGDPVIATGIDYMSFGMVTSMPYLDVCDGSYRQIRTDIIGRSSNGGLFLNLDDQVVGILGPDSALKDEELTLNGVGISEIRYMVDGLCNNREFAYFGIVGKEVTDALAEEFSMPRGVYVTQVKEDSPAMRRGIQTTDIISSVNGQTVENMKNFMAILRKLEPGDTVSVRFWRKSMNKYQETALNITLGKR